MPSNKPYYLKKHGKHDGTYVRIGSTNRKATPEILEELTRKQRHLSFHALPNYETHLDQLDLTQFTYDYQEITGRTLNRHLA